MKEGKEIKRGLFLCFLMLTACFVLGWVNTTQAKDQTQVVEEVIVNYGLYQIKGDKRKILSDSRMTKRNCIERSRAIVGAPADGGGHLEVVCKSDPVVIKKSRERNRGVSFP